MSEHAVLPSASGRGAPLAARAVETLADLEEVAARIGRQANRGEIDFLDAAARLKAIAQSAGLAATYGERTVQAHIFAGLRRADRQMDFEDALESAEGLIVTRMDQIETRALEWLWPDRIAIGKVTEFAGPGGVGKSTLLFDIAARVSRGAAWPDSPVGGIPQSVFILSAEDDPADTIKPRLEAAGADLGKVFFLPMIRMAGGAERAFSLDADIARLEQRIRQVGDVGLVEIDPLTAYLGKANPHSLSAVRGVLTPLTEMAIRTRVAVLGNTHFAKNGGKSALLRILGSVAFVNTPRLVFVVVPDPEHKGRRLVLSAKANLTGEQSGLAFRIEQTLVGDRQNIPATRIAWEKDALTITADEALASLKAAEGARTGKAEAMDFLRAELAHGPQPARRMAALAAEAGHSPRSVQVAREALGIKPTKSGPDGGWVWALPKITGAAAR